MNRLGFVSYLRGLYLDSFQTTKRHSYDGYSIYIAIFNSFHEAVYPVGRPFGYNVNATKSWLVVKESAQHVFAGTGVQTTSVGHPYLGAALGSISFINDYTQQRIGGGKGGGARGLKPPLGLLRGGLAPPQNDITPKLSFLEWG